jgi:hypothetical protein
MATVIIALLWTCVLSSLGINAQTLPRIAIGKDKTTRKPISFTQTRNPNWVPRQIPVTKHHIRMPEPLQEAVDELNTSELSNRSSLIHERANGQKATGTNGL